jgi:orotidine-5'-phosphate decarboxylase
VAEVSGKRVIVALDMPSSADASALAERLDPTRCRVKVGSELFTAAGPGLIEHLHRLGFEVFLDLKFHDIPNTVAAACKAGASLGVWMLNVHALGGRTMMEAAREAIACAGHRPLLVAVTVLTSIGDAELRGIGIEAPPIEMVVRLAALADAAGLDGVVCSAREAAALRARHASQFKLVTPGIRPAGAPGDDQNRIATPSQAVAAGVDYLVIGRPVTRAANPQAAIDEINAELDRQGSPCAT